MPRPTRHSVRHFCDFKKKKAWRGGGEVLGFFGAAAVTSLCQAFLRLQKKKPGVVVAEFLGFFGAAAVSSLCQAFLRFLKKAWCGGGRGSRFLWCRGRHVPLSGIFATSKKKAWRGGGEVLGFFNAAADT